MDGEWSMGDGRKGNEPPPQGPGPHHAATSVPPRARGAASIIVRAAWRRGRDASPRNSRHRPDSRDRGFLAAALRLSPTAADVARSSTRGEIIPTGLGLGLGLDWEWAWHVPSMRARCRPSTERVWTWAPLAEGRDDVTRQPEAMKVSPWIHSAMIDPSTLPVRKKICAEDLKLEA